MLKEIYEQPKAVRDTLNPRLKDKEINIEELGMSDEDICKIKKILIIGSGPHRDRTGGGV